MPDRRQLDRMTQIDGLVRDAFAWSGWVMVAVLAWVIVHQASPPVIEACQPGTPTHMVAPPFDRSSKP